MSSNVILECQCRNLKDNPKGETDVRWLWMIQVGVDILNKLHQGLQMTFPKNNETLCEKDSFVLWRTLFEKSLFKCDLTGKCKILKILIQII